MKYRKLINILITIFLISLGISYTLFKDFHMQSSLYKKIEGGHKYALISDKNGTSVAVFFPKSYVKNQSRKWVIFAHGSNGSNLDLIKLDGEKSLLKPLLDNGYVVIAPQYRNVVNWGNKEGIEDLVEAYKLGKEKYNLKQNPYMIIQSMGGLVALTSIAKGYIKPKAVIGLYPVTNLEYEYNNPQDPKSSIPSYINKAYGISEAKEFYTKTEGYDPLNNQSGEKYKAIPMMFISSYGDKIVPRQPNTDKFAEMVNASGGNVIVIDHTGNHGDISAFKFKKIVNFLNEH